MVLFCDMGSKGHRAKRSSSERWFEERGEPSSLDEDDDAPSAGSPDWKPPAWMTPMLLVVLTFLLVAYTYLRDEGTPWDADLTGATANATQGAPTVKVRGITAPGRMKAMLGAAERIHVSELSDRPPWEWSTPALGALLEKHSAVLDDLRDLLEEKEQEWDPASPLWQVEDFGNDAGWKGLMILKEAEVAYLTRREQEEAAFQEAIDMVELAHLLEKLDVWPSFMRRAEELHELGDKTLALLLKETRLSEAALTRLQCKEYQVWRPSDSALSSAMNGFYRYEKKLIMGPAPGDLPLPIEALPARSGRFLFKPNATLRLFAESFRELKDESQLTPFARVDQISSRTHHRYRQVKSGMGSPNASGEEYFLTRIQSYLAMLDQHSLARTRYSIVMTLFAFRRYVAGAGRVPAKLEELVPAYLPKDVLLDPFSNEPLRYVPDKGLIYSVGPKLKDEGGHPTPIPLSDPNEPTAETGIAVAKVAKVVK